MKTYLFLVTLLFCSCSGPGDNNNKNIPERIVSLAPSVTSMLYETGSGGKVVGVTEFCRYPGEKKEVIGTLISPNVEKIVSLKPDLIIGTMDGNYKQPVKRMEKMGLRIHTLPRSDNYRSIESNFLKVGELTGRMKTAEKKLEKIRREIEAVRSRVEKLPRVRVFVEIGTKPLVTISKDTYINEIIETAGGENMVTESGRWYPKYSVEKVVSDDPDMIIVVSMGMEYERELKRWGRYGDMKAVRNNGIKQIDPNIMTLPTPVNFLKGVRESAKLFYPGVFDK